MNKKKKSIYIAGPMTGLPEFNFPAFFKAERKLRRAGWLVWNPAAKDSEAAIDKTAKKTGDDKLAIKKGFDIREAFMWDAEKVIYADGIYMLEGWEKSPGARAEHAIATFIQMKHPEYKIIYA